MKKLFLTLITIILTFIFSSSLLNVKAKEYNVTVKLYDLDYQVLDTLKYNGENILTSTTRGYIYAFEIPFNTDLKSNINGTPLITNMVYDFRNYDTNIDFIPHTTISEMLNGSLNYISYNIQQYTKTKYRLILFFPTYIKDQISLSVGTPLTYNAFKNVLLNDDYDSALTRLIDISFVLDTNYTYSKGYDEGQQYGYDLGYNEALSSMLDLPKPDNLYIKGQYKSGTAYSNKLYFDTKNLVYNQNDKFLMLQFDPFNVISQFQIYFKDINDNQVAYINYVLDGVENPTNIKIVNGLSQNLDVKSFIISLNEYDLTNAKTYYIDFLTSPSPQGNWLEKMNNTLETSSSNYWSAFYNGLVIDIYNNGYRQGTIDENFRASDEIATYGYEQYLRGKSDGLKANNSEAYKEGLAKGINDNFFSDFDKWIVPAIIVVLVLGGFLTIRSKRNE